MRSGAAGGWVQDSDVNCRNSRQPVFLVIRVCCQSSAFAYFAPRLKRLDESLILAGTGGKLTMLAERGSGILAGKVHDRTFDDIADRRARGISECFQQSFDAEILDEAHPGEPHLVYFHFGSDHSEDLKTLCDNVLALSQAGIQTDPAWLAEKTGYQLSTGSTSAKSQRQSDQHLWLRDVTAM